MNWRTRLASSVSGLAATTLSNQLLASVKKFTTSCVLSAAPDLRSVGQEYCGKSYQMLALVSLSGRNNTFLFLDHNRSCTERLIAFILDPGKKEREKSVEN